MPRSHNFYLSLGSNIFPERNLAGAVQELRDRGEVGSVSSVWESQAVGSNGPNFLNVCVAFASPLPEAELKTAVVDVVETNLGRVRSGDRNAPRTIDIDIIMEDGRALHLERWDHGFVVLPMADLLPDFPHPRSQRRLADEAVNIAATTWFRKRPDITLASPQNDASVRL